MNPLTAALRGSEQVATAWSNRRVLTVVTPGSGYVH